MWHVTLNDSLVMNVTWAAVTLSFTNIALKTQSLKSRTGQGTVRSQSSWSNEG